MNRLLIALIALAVTGGATLYFMYQSALRDGPYVILREDTDSLHAEMFFNAREPMRQALLSVGEIDFEVSFEDRRLTFTPADTARTADYLTALNSITNVTASAGDDGAVTAEVSPEAIETERLAQRPLLLEKLRWRTGQFSSFFPQVNELEDGSIEIRAAWIEKDQLPGGKLAENAWVEIFPSTQFTEELGAQWNSQTYGTGSDGNPETVTVFASLFPRTDVTGARMTRDDDGEPMISIALTNSGFSTLKTWRRRPGYEFDFGFNGRLRGTFSMENELTDNELNLVIGRDPEFLASWTDMAEKIALIPLPVNVTLVAEGTGAYDPAGPAAETGTQ